MGKTKIFKAYPLEEAQDAIEEYKKDMSRGKMLLIPSMKVNEWFFKLRLSLSIAEMFIKIDLFDSLYNLVNFGSHGCLAEQLDLF